MSIQSGSTPFISDWELVQDKGNLSHHTNEELIGNTKARSMSTRSDDGEDDTSFINNSNIVLADLPTDGIQQKGKFDPNVVSFSFSSISSDNKSQVVDDNSSKSSSSWSHIENLSMNDNFSESTISPKRINNRRNASLSPSATPVNFSSSIDRANKVYSHDRKKKKTNNPDPDVSQNYNSDLSMSSLESDDSKIEKIFTPGTTGQERCLPQKGSTQSICSIERSTLSSTSSDSQFTSNYHTKYNLGNYDSNHASKDPIIRDQLAISASKVSGTFSFHDENTKNFASAPAYTNMTDNLILKEMILREEDFKLLIAAESCKSQRIVQVGINSSEQQEILLNIRENGTNQTGINNIATQEISLSTDENQIVEDSQTVKMEATKQKDSFYNILNNDESSMSIGKAGNKSTDSGAQNIQRQDNNLRLISCPKCTLLNHPFAVVCSICESLLVVDPDLNDDEEFARHLQQQFYQDNSCLWERSQLLTQQIHAFVTRDEFKSKGFGIFAENSLKSLVTNFLQDAVVADNRRKFDVQIAYKFTPHKGVLHNICNEGFKTLNAANNIQAAYKYANFINSEEINDDSICQYYRAKAEKKSFKAKKSLEYAKEGQMFNTSMKKTKHNFTMMRYRNEVKTLTPKLSCSKFEEERQNGELGWIVIMLVPKVHHSNLNDSYCSHNRRFYHEIRAPSGSAMQYKALDANHILPLVYFDATLRGTDEIRLLVNGLQSIFLNLDSMDMQCTYYEE